MDYRTLATEMIGVSPLSIERVSGGGNNQLYKITAMDGQCYALKLYSQDKLEVDQIRLQREYTALTFLWQQGEKNIPRAVVQNPRVICALYEWIIGESIVNIKHDDLIEVLAFISRLKKYSRLESARALMPAADNALDGQTLVSQVERRLLCLGQIDDVRLKRFLTQELLPVMQSVLQNLPTWQVPLEKAILSPSDFGFHNSLRCDGRLVFIDFEYFGWEDPAAMLAHLLWHPGMVLSDSQKSYLIEHVMALFDEDVTFGVRYTRLFPLIGLIWTLILLNEFIPSHWQRRVGAGTVVQDQWQEKMALQLCKARQYLTRIRQC